MHVTEAVEAFRREEESLGLAAPTREGHDVQLRKLLKAVRQWEVSRGKRSPMKTAEIDGKLITLYYDQCVGGAGSRNNMNSVLRGFLDFCERQRWLESGTRARLLLRYKNKPYQRAPKHYIEAKDFPGLLDSQTRHSADRVTMALLVYTLCRKSELAGLRVRDVDMDTLTLKVYRSKTRRNTEVGICPELYEELSKWLLDYEYTMGTRLDPDWYLLPRLEPHRYRGADGRWEGGGCSYSLQPLLQPDHMELVVKRGLSALGVATDTNHRGEGAHTIRRSGARAMLKHLSPLMGNSDALVTVSAMLDHADVKVTLKYIGMDIQKEELNEWLRSNPMYG